MNITLTRVAVGGAIALACPLAAAQGVASEQQLQPVQVVGTRSPLDPNLPSSTYSITADELAKQPIVNTQDALQYAPNAMVRKLRPGDTNGGLAGRSFGPGQPQRALAYVDGLLISNFLASHQVPRWSMVDPAHERRQAFFFGAAQRGEPLRRSDLDGLPGFDAARPLPVLGAEGARRIGGSIGVVGALALALWWATRRRLERPAP